MEPQLTPKEGEPNHDRREYNSSCNLSIFMCNTVSTLINSFPKK